MIARTKAQAKINLGLRILSREPGGFHTLETFFHQLELADDVSVRRTAGERALVISGPALPPDGLGPARDNLAWRAADAYATAAGWDGGFAIELVKRIPAGGGLGGGSSDAGAVLRACDRLNPEPLGARRLAAMAAALGSDVAFLASEAAAAVGRGRGERLEPAPALPALDVALVFPPFGVPTKDAYSWLAASRGAYEPLAPTLDADRLRRWDSVAAHATNDFEPVVIPRHPEIGSILDALRAAGAMLALMSGSGSTVFGIFAPDAADGARRSLASADALAGGARVVWTRTATRVVPVVVSG